MPRAPVSSVLTQKVSKRCMLSCTGVPPRKAVGKCRHKQHPFKEAPLTVWALILASASTPKGQGHCPIHHCAGSILGVLKGFQSETLGQSSQEPGTRHQPQNHLAFALPTNEPDLALGPGLPTRRYVLLLLLLLSGVSPV